jgi:pterin-4a-carbinolamine dehydratase
MAESQPSSAWHVQQHPPLLTRRFEFGTYAEARRFLDELATLSDRRGYYPDLNFGKSHVSVSIAARDDTLGDAEFGFASQADALAGKATC